MRREGLRGFWWRWVVANSLAEGVGLTASLALGAGAFAVNDRLSLGVALLSAAGVAVTAAAVEGLAVGSAQWLVLRRALPAMPWRPWTLATAIGALVAWMLGMLPSTLLSVANAATAAPAAAPAPAEPPLALQLLLAALLGAVLGPILGVPQWRVLRRFLSNAGWWVLANSAAWAAGMPFIFLAASFIQPGMPVAVIAAIVAAGCLAAGAVVGMVHGAWLVALLRRAQT